MIQLKKIIAAQVANALANYKTIFLDSADNKLKTKDESGVIENIATVEGLAAAEPKVYIALLTQSGTDAPIATVLKNTLGGEVVWSYDDIGRYTGTLINGFMGDTNINSLTPVFNRIVAGDFTGDINRGYIIFKNNDSSVILKNISGSETYDNNILRDTFIKIEVYP